MTPKHSCFWNCIKAFLVGGSICLLGEILIQWYQSMGNDRELAGLYGTLSRDTGHKVCYINKCVQKRGLL